MKYFCWTILSLFFVLAVAWTTTAMASQADPTISVSNLVADKGKKVKIEGMVNIKVLSGKYKLINNLEAWTGSNMDIRESWMTFPKGLVIEIGAEGATLKGTAYPEGTRLRVNEKGELKRVK